MSACDCNLELKRSNSVAEGDTFRVLPYPVPALNPAKTNHLYVAYAGRRTNANDKADIFFVSSTNGGANWTMPVRVNSDTTTNDQWMPVLAVKPDGTQLFMAWYEPAKRPEQLADRDVRPLRDDCH